MGNIVEDFIQHYNTQVYDAAKAHAYYLKKRQLKSVSPKAVISTPKVIASLSKDDIKSKKKLDDEAAKKARDLSIARFQASADKMRSDLSLRLKILGKSGSSDERSKIASDLKQAIAHVRSAYKTASDKIDSTYKTASDKIDETNKNNKALKALASASKPKANSKTAKAVNNSKAKVKAKTKSKAKAKKASGSNHGIIYYTKAEMAANKLK